jgi:hypothetical protein
MCLERGKIDGAQTCLEALIELAETEPKFFRTVLRDVTDSMAKVRCIAIILTHAAG